MAIRKTAAGAPTRERVDPVLAESRRCRRAVRRTLAYLSCFACTALAAPAQANDPDPVASIAPTLLEELHASGLIGTAEPVRPFAWTIVMTRPLRAARHRRETYAGTPQGAPAGLSPMVRDELTDEGRTKRTVHGVSVRGLIFVRPGESELEVRVRGLRMPLEEGERFRIEYDDDSGELAEDCTVLDDVAASAVHASIPGRATRIECEGSGRYKRIPVSVSAKVMYLHEPGVFVAVEQAIDSPLGRLRSGVRVVAFAMERP